MTYSEIKTDLVINKMTMAMYDELLAKGQINDNEIYYILDDNDKFYLKSEVYTKAEINEILANYTPGSGGGTIVVANPELDGGEDILESIQIEDVKYSLQGQDMTFSETISENPEAKVLKTITIGTDDWKVDKGSVVTPNVELNGDEPVLESVQIDDATFTLKGEEMIFSETAVEGATILKTIQLGDDHWSTGYAELLARIEALEALLAK